MKIQAPSPSMGVALLALAMASTGTAVAAVSYATNAGKVDGRDAVSSKSSTDTAAGKLVATAGAGPLKGKIPGKFLAEVQRGDADTFARYAEVQDNATDVASPLTTIPEIGTLSASCGDQSSKAGVEDPISQIVFSNTSGVGVNIVKSTGVAAPEITVVQPNTTSELNMGGTNTFHLLLEKAGTDAVVEGVVRQDGRGSAAAQCLVFGYVEEIPNIR
ncbi:MAG: hypothetical protein QM679_06110 [Patulibacter sp.]